MSRMSLRVAVATFAAVASLLTVGSIDTASAHTGQGNATPANNGWHPWSTDGCSWSPNALPPIFNFLHACIHHDGCYAGFPRNGRPTYWVSRYQCDAWFYYDMMASCRWQHGFAPARVTCEGYAYKYFLAVRALGRWAYKGPTNN